MPKVPKKRPAKRKPKAMPAAARAAPKAPPPTSPSLKVPGTRYQCVIKLDAATGKHRATIADGETHGIPALQDLSSAEMVELMTALRCAEREAWRLDGLVASHADRA